MILLKEINMACVHEKYAVLYELLDFSVVCLLLSS